MARGAVRSEQWPVAGPPRVAGDERAGRPDRARRALKAATRGSRKVASQNVGSRRLTGRMALAGLLATCTSLGVFSVSPLGRHSPPSPPRWADRPIVARLTAVAQHTARTPAPAVGGYGLVSTAGVVSTFGDAAYLGDQFGQVLNRPVVGAASTSDLRGYWMAAADGGVFAFGDADFMGSEGGKPLASPVVGMAGTGTDGYWLVAADGGVFAFGSAGFFGSMGGRRLAAPIVGMAAVPGGGGYWLVAADGGVFAFGAAAYDGSMGGHALHSPMVGMAAVPGGGGYWLVAADGGVFCFGSARFSGSLGSQSLAAPVVAMLPASSGLGYLLVGADGGVFAFGDVSYEGSAVDPLHPPLYTPFMSESPPPPVAALWIAPGPEVASSGPVRISVMGDSLGYMTAFGFEAVAAHYGATVQNGSIAGCGLDIPGVDEGLTWSSPVPFTAWPACADWLQRDEASIASSHPDVVALFAGYWECQRWWVNGTLTDIADPAFASLVTGQIDQLAALVHHEGAKLVLFTSPYFDDGTPDGLVDTYNSLVRQVAQATGATVLDVNAVLDPAGTYTSTVDGVTVREADGVHLTIEGVLDVLVPALLPTLTSLGAGARS